MFLSTSIRLFIFIRCLRSSSSSLSAAKFLIPNDRNMPVFIYPYNVAHNQPPVYYTLPDQKVGADRAYVRGTTRLLCPRHVVARVLAYACIRARAVKLEVRFFTICEPGSLPL